MTDPATQKLRTYFENLSPGMMDSIVEWLAPEDPEAIAEEAAARFESFLPDMPYADQPDHIMAWSMYFCMAVLAFKDPLVSRGYSAHDLGRATLDLVRRGFEGVDPDDDPSQRPEAVARARQDALASQQAARPDEFVFEIVEGEAGDDYGMNIKSCAICKAYAKHDARDLVPYLCATDDIVSDALDQGLRRTGTIALGAHRCDFRFKHGGAGRALADQYPSQLVRWKD